MGGRPVKYSRACFEADSPACGGRGARSIFAGPSKRDPWRQLLGTVVRNVTLHPPAKVRGDREITMDVFPLLPHTAKAAKSSVPDGI